jgi:spore germination protein
MNANLVGTASPFWYSISGDSTIADDPGAGEESVIKKLRDRHIRVVPTVTEAAGLPAFVSILESHRRREAMARALVTIATSRDYSGLDLDFENFALDPHHNAALASEAAARYPAFIAQVCSALRERGRTCTVTIMPRTSRAHVYWRKQFATWVYGYAALAKAANRVRIMAYDEHAPGGRPGPISSISWVKRVIAYARSTMVLNKVELALPAYGYDWSAAGATSITSRQALRLALQRHAALRWKPRQAETTFRYTLGGARHVVWYQNPMASYERASLAKSAGFAGIDFWSAGGEAAALWPKLRALFSE